MASVMVSYLRARAEGLGIKCDIGIMTRPERVAAIGIAICISEWIPETILVVLFLITLLCFFTTIQRIAYSWRNLD
jgi:CDP-diacylglycerol--glycerol-3-phosphate 3-phosphatidyltransferase